LTPTNTPSTKHTVTIFNSYTAYTTALNAGQKNIKFISTKGAGDWASDSAPFITRPYSENNWDYTVIK